MTGPLVDPGSVPPWLAPLVRRSAGLTRDDLVPGRVRLPPDDGTGRRAAVLVLFADGPDGPDVLLLRRADTLSSHAGQVAFPGGALDPGEEPVAAALREAAEECGVRADGVRPVAVLPELHVPPSGFRVTPVIAHWERPGPVAAVDPAETAAVARVPLAVLADPSTRVLVRRGEWAFPAFVLPGMLVWGFTGGLVDALLGWGGWERPWRPAPEHDVDSALRLAGGAR